MISRRQTKRHSCVELSLPPVHKYKLMINQSIVKDSVHFYNRFEVMQ